MRIDCYQRFQDIPLTASQWNALVKKNATNTIFQTYEWSSIWWNVFSDQHELVFCLASEEDEVVGFAAMMLSDNEYGRKSLRFLADRNSDYCDFIINCNPLSFIQAIYDFFSREFTDWACMQLRNMPEPSQSLAGMKTLSEPFSWHVRESAPIAAPRRCLDDSKLSRKNQWQYSVRRPYKRMKKEGRLSFRHIDDPAEAQRIYQLLISQHIQRYSHKGQVSLFEDRHNIDFFTRLTPVIMDAGWLDLCVLEFNDKPVAIHYGFKYGSTLTWYKPSFDITYGQYSPGTVLTKYLIEYAEDAGLRVVDFTIGDEAFKERFCTRINYNRSVSVYKHTLHAYMHSSRTMLASAYKKMASWRD